MTYRIDTHDGWGVVTVGRFESLEQASRAFDELCQDPWYRQDGSVRGIELLDDSDPRSPQCLQWQPFA